MISQPRFVATLVAFAGLASCATPNVTMERRPDGLYHVKCKTPLQLCLNEAERVCDRKRYAVVRAFDEHNLRGDSSQPEDFRTSEAFFRCVGGAWRDEDKAAMSGDLGAGVGIVVAAPALACMPGSTQVCVGAGACKGGQSCAADGSRFSSCDCGGTPPPPPPPP